MALGLKGNWIFRGPFLESPHNYRARKAIQEKGFNKFTDDMIKLSVNKTNWTGLLASTRAFIF